MYRVLGESEVFPCIFKFITPPLLPWFCLEVWCVSVSYMLRFQGDCIDMYVCTFYCLKRKIQSSFNLYFFFLVYSVKSFHAPFLYEQNLKRCSYSFFVFWPTISVICLGPITNHVSQNLLLCEIKKIGRRYS